MKQGDAVFYRVKESEDYQIGYYEKGYSKGIIVMTNRLGMLNVENGNWTLDEPTKIHSKEKEDNNDRVCSYNALFVFFRGEGVSNP